MEWAPRTEGHEPRGPGVRAELPYWVHLACEKLSGSPVRLGHAGSAPAYANSGEPGFPTPWEGATTAPKNMPGEPITTSAT
jgi:hypothetical protein